MEWDEKLDLFTIVMRDLAAVERWSRASSNDELRLQSVILRRLLLDGLLGRAWRQAGFNGEPKIQAKNLEWLDPERSDVDYSNVLVAVMSTPYHLAESLELPSPISLTDFLAGTLMVVNGEVVTRRLLVKYVANKLGGVHFDERRDDEEGRVYRQLDSLSMAIYGKQEPFAQLLEIGLALVASDDIQNLKLKIAPKSNS